MNKLITHNHVVAILGEVASSRSLEAAPICQQNKIPMISPSSTNPNVTETGDYIFRVCFIDPFQGSVIDARDRRPGRGPRRGRCDRCGRSRRERPLHEAARALRSRRGAARRSGAGPGRRSAAHAEARVPITTSGARGPTSRSRGSRRSRRAITGAELHFRPILVGGVFNAVNEDVYRMRANPNRY